MRYYEFTISINENAALSVAKSDIGYFDNPVQAINSYLYKNALNNMSAFAFSKDDNSVKMALYVDEKQLSTSKAYETIESQLKKLDRRAKIVDNLTDITRFQFSDDLLESRRRDYCSSYMRIREGANIEYLEFEGDRHAVFNLEERIISLDNRVAHEIYDKTLRNEINNIKTFKNKAGFESNPVHYVVSSETPEAAKDMTDLLVQNLYFANRISSRRVEVISEISTNMFKYNYLESIIEDSYGGVVIIDMTEKLGDSTSDHTLNCEHLCKLIKKHKNNCLFILTYNTGKPGLMYKVLPRIQEYTYIVPIKEGYGDKKTASSYLKSLVKNSHLAKDANRVDEFLKNKLSDRFSQSDVLAYFERFESWCMSQTMFKGYSSFSAFASTPAMGLQLEHDDITTSPSERLDSMIGLNSVKARIHEIIAANVIDRERMIRPGNDYSARTMHMIFAGNPGTAKTTVAKLFGEIAKEQGLIRSGVFKQKSGTEFSPLSQESMRNAFDEAKGGILFIDEAYALGDVTTMLQEMENHRDDVVVILAGYDQAMKQFLGRNDGLKSRIPNWVTFEDYSSNELVDILKLMLKDRGFTASEKCFKVAYNNFDKAVCLDNFGNGRYVRNYLEKAIERQSTRICGSHSTYSDLSEEELFTLDVQDFESESYVADEADTKDASNRLDSMIGLTSAKEVIAKAIASFKMRKLYNDMGLTSEKPSMHMVFTGNPGTAKTTTARLIAQIMKNEGILPSGNFVEAGRADLIAQYAGQTAPLVKKKFSEARGGVLFIDEAYSLCDSQLSGLGDEAINTIVQEMENHREDTVVIFAGYPEPMKEFLERNPGMKSRISFHIEFEDYTVDELCRITELIASDKHISLTPKAMDKLRMIYSVVSTSDDYGNGRFVRQILEDSMMNLAQRLMAMDINSLSKETLTTLEEEDIKYCAEKGKKPAKTFGFGLAS